MASPSRNKRSAGKVTSHFRVTRSTRARTDKNTSKDTKNPNGLTSTESPSPLSQNEIDDARELLRQFDMTYKYGPCVGIGRTFRWERAQNFGLDPPTKAIELLKDKKYQMAIDDFDLHLWHNEL